MGWCLWSSPPWGFKCTQGIYTGRQLFISATSLSGFSKVAGLSLGQRLYALYGTPLGPGAAADLAALMTSWTSLRLGSLMSNSAVGITQGVAKEEVNVIRPGCHSSYHQAISY